MERPDAMLRGPEAALDLEEFGESEVQRKRVLLTINKIVVVVTLTYTLFFAAMSWWQLTAYNAFFLLWYIGTVLLAGRERSRLAGIVLNGGGLLHLCGVSLLFVPPMSGIQIFLALLPIFSVLSIFPADRIWITSYTVISMVVLTGLELNRDSYVAPFAVEMSAQVMGLCRGLSIAFTVGMIVAVFVSFFLDLHRARLGLRKAHDQSEALLHNILPSSIAERLKAGEEPIADDYEDVSILFTDLVGFTRLAATQAAHETVAMLNDVVSAFDVTVSAHGLEKIKTIGDAYMLAAGVPDERPDHATQMIRVAHEMQRILAEYNARTGHDLELRIGISSGPVTAGVIGSKKFIYDLWGDTVNVASRMESTGLPGRIQVTEAVAHAARETFTFEDRGLIEVKGKGQMQTFLVALPE
jgi:class 3 adenylate cyclase